MGWIAAWAGGWGLALIAQFSVGRMSDTRWVHPVLLFTMVIASAALCLLSSGLALLRAWRSGIAESAALGTFFMGTSVLALAHGLTVPGVVYGANTASMATMYWAVPVGSVLLIPTFFPRQRWANEIMAHWRLLSAAVLALQVLLVGAVLASPDWLPAPVTGSAGALAAVAPIIAFCLLLSYRHLRLALIARSAGPMAVSASAALLAASSLVITARGTWTAAFWLGHLLDLVAVFAGTVVGAVVYRRSDSLSALLVPIDTVTPLRAVELGMDPLVRRFVAQLERKDTTTRDHVVRTAHMAAAVAEQLGLPFEEVRTIALGALLHDLGKLEVPDHILNKTGPLEPAEYEIVKRHPVDGERLVLDSPALGDLAPVIRGHHERFDGNGYPDRLAGQFIPLGARIVSACDAYDAMANTRQYRDGMGRERALQILHEHAGTQWDAGVVAAVTRVLEVRAGDFGHDAFTDVGREPDHRSCEVWGGCGDALPAGLGTASSS